MQNRVNGSFSLQDDESSVMTEDGSKEVESRAALRSSAVKYLSYNENLLPMFACSGQLWLHNSPNGSQTQTHTRWTYSMLQSSDVTESSDESRKHLRLIESLNVKNLETKWIPPFSKEPCFYLLSKINVSFKHQAEFVSI